MRLLLQEGPSGASQALNLRRTEKWCTALIGAALGSAFAALVLFTLWPLLVSAAAVCLVVILNLHFYRFLREQRGLAFALRAIPLHLLYYFVSGISAIVGWMLHHLVGAPQPPQETAARGGVGIQSWPPSPAAPAASLWNSTSAKVGRQARGG